MKATKRQEEVLFWVQKGLSNKQIAQRLNISDSTVKLHIGKLLKMYGVRTRLQLSIFSLNGKVVELPTDLEKEPCGWVLVISGTIKGVLFTNKPPNNKWKPIYLKESHE